MLAVLIKLIFSSINLISHIITKAIFSTAAYLVVLLIQAFKVPGEATKGILEQAADAFRTILEKIMDVIIEVISSILSAFFNVIKDGIIDSIVSGSSAIGDLIEETKNAFEGLLNDVPEIIQGFVEMVSTLISDVLSNCMEALGYVQQNA